MVVGCGNVFPPGARWLAPTFMLVGFLVLDMIARGSSPMVAGVVLAVMRHILPHHEGTAGMVGTFS